MQTTIARMTRTVLLIDLGNLCGGAVAAQHDFEAVVSRKSGLDEVLARFLLRLELARFARSDRAQAAASSDGYAFHGAFGMALAGAGAAFDPQFVPTRRFHHGFPGWRGIPQIQTLAR